MLLHAFTLDSGRTCLAQFAAAWFIAVTTIAATPPCRSAETADRIVRWAEEERRVLQAEKATLDQRYQQAQQALQRAQTALSRAQQANNPQAIAISQQAVRTADQALENVRLARQHNLNRLAGFERARQWGLMKRNASPGSQQAVAVPTVFTPDELLIRTAQGAWQRFEGSRPLAPGDAVRTGKGRAEFVVDDGSRLILDSDTELEFISGDETRSLFRMLRGLIHSAYEPCVSCPRRKVGPGPIRGQLIEYRTPVATIAVRGTAFDLGHGSEGLSSVVVYEGEVELQSSKRAGRAVIRQGERAEVRADGSIIGPGKSDLRRLDKWWEKL
jgi:hypothetical protein